MITFFLNLIGLSLCFNLQTNQTEYSLTETNEVILAFTGTDTSDSFYLQEVEENKFCAIKDK